MRTALSDWIDKTFGGIHVQDMFTLDEEVGATKQEGVYHRKITVALRKNEGVKKDWACEETFDRWKKEIKEIIGAEGLIKLDIKSAEGKELNYVAGIRKGEKSKEEFTDGGGRIFTYRFTLSIIKRVTRTGG